jgi:hypothetical protein
MNFKSFYYICKRNRIVSYFRRIYYGIENLISWFFIIWKDRQWDDVFVYILLRHKLRRMSKYFRKHGTSISASKDADNVDKCIKVLDRLINSDYTSLAYNGFYKRWGEPEILLDGRSIKIVHSNVVDSKTERQFKGEYKHISNREGYLRKQDVDYLFRLLSKQILNWWD